MKKQNQIRLLGRYEPSSLSVLKSPMDWFNGHTKRVLCQIKKDSYFIPTFIATFVRSVGEN